MIENEKKVSQEVVNISSNVVRFEIEGLRHVLKPGERASIHVNYALPRQFANNRDPIPSAIDLMTGGAVVSVLDKRAMGHART
jgi:hypothetical protein